ncbi:prolyl-tRNA synthetase [Candidatus Saccharibacteria bacterium]|nr:prolyl-tRNA synthetase [Candidatus Saccharibacteria bacterium]
MRRSKLFIKTRRQAPADEESKNAQLLIRAGYIHKDSAGVYALLPMGLAVVENIKTIVREEMNKAGASELLMTTLQRKELWETTDRWDDEKVDIWFKSKLANGNDVGLAWSHEEPIGEMMREFIASYRDLPAYAYQFQNKLRNEIRAKSGIMRAREFLMKDLYSFSRTEEQHQDFYNHMIKSYLKVFYRIGLGDNTFLTFASGGAFTKFSHEFQTICDAGEDIVYLDREKGIAINEEVFNDEVIEHVGLNKDSLEKVKTAEVGNIFSFGTHKSEQLGLFFSDEDGSSKPVVLGSYGIGITRLVGVLTEHFADDKGLVWPENVAPYQVYLANVGNETEILQATDELYDKLQKAEIPVIYDDRDERPGEKFADADLFGIPYRVVVSSKSLQSGGFELKSRTSTDTEVVPTDKLLSVLTKARQA